MWFRNFYIVFLLYNLQIVKIRCENGISLAFAIDNTCSIGSVLDGFKRDAEAILNVALAKKSNTIEDFVLVTINDPDVELRTKTGSKEEFLEQVKKTTIYRDRRNNSCEGMSLSGIETALEYSRFGSYVFVFIDAKAKDYDKVEKIKYLCQKKQIQVIFILTGHCNQSDTKGYLVYYDIARATLGHVLLVDINEVDEVPKAINYLLYDKKTVIAWKTLKPSYAYRKIEFKVDDNSTDIIISSSSLDMDLQITETPSLLFGNKVPIENIIWNSNAKVGKLAQPRCGTYYLWVNGSSVISVVVYTTPGFTFQYGFSTEETAKSLEYTSKQPFDNSDISQHLYIETTDDSVDLDHVILVDMYGKVLIKLQARNIGKKFFITPSFTVPPFMFNIKIIGFTKPDRKLVIKVSEKPIDPSPTVTIETLPKVNIIETRRNLAYGETAEFTCKVESFTKPYIQWNDDQGSIWENMPTQISANDYYIRLKVSQIIKAATYTCLARNSLGVTKVNLILNVSSPFDIKHRPVARTEVPYGEAKTILCDVRSLLPIKNKWYRYKNNSKSLEQIVQSDKLWISSTGTKFIIKNMDLELNGTYKCVASLESNPRHMISFDTDIVVTGLEKPKIVYTNGAVIGNQFSASCRVEGAPEPTISWQFKPNGSEEFHTTSISGEYFFISDLTVEDSGTYRCVAVNYLGTTEVELKPIEVVPETLPEINITEGVNVLVNYDTEIILTCQVKAHPKPKIVWFTSDGLVLLPFKVSEENSTEYFSQLKLSAIRNTTYTCKAVNKKGTSSKNVKVKVRSVFRVVSFPAELANVKYNETVNITCDIKSNYWMNITWYKDFHELVGKNEYNISADRTVLTFKAKAPASQGMYRCRVYLVLDPVNRMEFTTIVKIKDLVLPVINSSISNVNISKGDKIYLKCQIVKGYPRPQVWWYKKNGHSRQVLNKMGEILQIENAVFSDAGQYECMAVNVFGNVSAVIDVTVRNLPDITIEETQRNFHYGSVAEFTCNVESHNEPTIQWIDKKERVLEHEVKQISEYKYYSRLKLNMLRKAAVYTCVATNDVGVSKANVDLKVAVPFEVKNDADILISYGTVKAVPCEIKSSQPFVIKWYRMNSDLSTRAEVVPSDELSITPDGTKLIINGTDSDLSGTYICEASLASDPTKKIGYNINVNFTGLVAPEIIKLDATVKDKNLTAVCKVKGVPKPKVSWHFKPNKFPAFHNISVSGEELKIPILRRDDAGVYKCVATSVVGQVHRKIKVFVKEAPVITNENTKMVALKGDRVLRIPCNVTGSPKPLVNWWKNDAYIKNNAKFEVRENELFIKDVTDTDTANFTCAALNILGLAQKTFEIHVTDSFKTDNDALKGQTYSILAIKKNPVNMTCNLTSSETVQPRWYLNGQHTYYSGSTYEIESANKDDIGIYTCRVDSSTGATSQSFDLQIGSPPHFVYKSWSPDAAIEEVLDCTVTSDPEAEIQWIHNGLVIPGNNYTQEYIANEWGQYQCIASNMFGSIERTYNISSTDCYVNHYMVTQNMPLWFNKTTIFPTSSAGITLAANKSIVLICPSSNTLQKFPTKNNITVQCYKEDKFIFDGKTYKFSELQCAKKVEPSFLYENEECSGPYTEMIKVGYKLDAFLETYQICYDRKNNVPVFGSTHIVIDDFVKEQKWLKSSQLLTGGLTCESNECCYSKSSLVSEDQMVFGPPQDATLIDILNSVAVWVPCQNEDRMSWKTFEWKFKAWSSLEQTNFESWTGASFYKDVDGIRIPRYLWKVIKYNGEITAVVYVNHQDPGSDDLLCSSSCEPLSMLNLETEAAANSFYCCSLDQFSRAFNINSFNNNVTALLISSS